MSHMTANGMPTVCRRGADMFELERVIHLLVDTLELMMLSRRGLDPA